MGSVFIRLRVHVRVRGDELELGDTLLIGQLLECCIRYLGSASAHPAKNPETADELSNVKHSDRDTTLFGLSNFERVRISTPTARLDPRGSRDSSPTSFVDSRNR